MKATPAELGTLKRCVKQQVCHKRCIHRSAGEREGELVEAIMDERRRMMRRRERKRETDAPAIGDAEVH